MLTVHRIFEIYGLNPTNIKLVRHGNKEIPVHKTFKENLPRFEIYQSYQKPRKFGNAKTIAVFAPYSPISLVIPQHIKGLIKVDLSCIHLESA